MKGLTFKTMNRALKGARLLLMIPVEVDHSLGSVELSVGAYGQMLEDAAGIKATDIGKPGTYIFDAALEGINADRDSVLMIGDRVATDIVGARGAGIKSVLMKTGEFKTSDLNGEVQPDFIVNSVNKIDALF